MSIPELYTSLETEKNSISLVDDIVALEERLEEYMDDNDSENILADVAVIEELMSDQHMALSTNEEVKKRLEHIIADARWHTLWLQQPEDAAQLFENHFDMFFEYNWESVLHDIRDVLVQEEELEARDEWKKRVREAIEQSAYSLGDNLMIIDGQNEEPTIRNWFSAYREYVGEKSPDALSIVEFLNSSANSSLLTVETRPLLEGVLKLDLELYQSSFTAEGLEEKIIVPDPNTGTYHILDKGSDIDTGIEATEEELAEVRAEMGLNEDGTPMKISEQVKREVLGSRYAQAPVQVDEAPAAPDAEKVEENESEESSVQDALVNKLQPASETEEAPQAPVDFSEGLTIPVPPSISLHVEADEQTLEEEVVSEELEESAAEEMEALTVDTELQGQPVSFPEIPEPEIELPELPEVDAVELDNAPLPPAVEEDAPTAVPELPELPPLHIPELPAVEDMFSDDTVAADQGDSEQPAMPELPEVPAPAVEEAMPMPETAPALAPVETVTTEDVEIDYKQVAHEVLSELQLLLESYAAEKRFLSLVTNYANGSVEKEEVTKQLSAAPEEGGVHLHPDQVAMVLQTTDAMIDELVNHPRAAAAQAEQHVGGGIRPTLEMVEKQISRQKEMQEYKAAEQGTVETQPEDDLVDIFANMATDQSAPAKKQEDDAVLERLRTEAPVEIKELPHPEMMGPLEELEHFTVEEFRRLGEKNIQDAVKEISEAIHLLAEESIQRKADGIDAWKQSPLNQLYIAIGNESFNEARPVTEIIAERQAAGKEILTEDEFHAIADLNSHLRF